MIEKKENEKYQTTIISNKCHKITLSIEINNSKICFSCVYFEDYFQVKYLKEYSLEELKSKINYFKQFNKENEILEEIKNNNLKGQEKILEDEKSETIKLIIPLPIYNFKNIEFTLEKIKKTKEELFEEYKSIISIYKAKMQIKDFNSKIIFDTEQKEIIKSFISYYDKLKAKLLYSFYITYTDEEIKNNLENKKIAYTVKEFHEKCDNIPSILVVCKSGDQIFGGYTPLPFKSNDSYGNDKDSFIFSLNRKEKYQKKSSSNSIWCYKNYGPCFSYDLEFIEGKINIVKFYEYDYSIPHPFFKENDGCLKNKYSSDVFLNSSNVFLNSLEIFQIMKNK